MTQNVLYAESDDLAPARGIKNGCLVSASLWLAFLLLLWKGDWLVGLIRGWVK